MAGVIGGSLNDVLGRAVAKRGDSVALVMGDRELSYRQVDDYVAGLAGALKQRGTSPGDRVAIHSHNSLEQIVAYFAVLRLGAIAVPLNFRLAGDEVAEILGNIDARILITDAENHEEHRGHGHRLVSPSATLVVGHDDVAHGPCDCLDVESESRAASPVRHWPALAEQTPAFIIYSGGTTGKPKGTLLSHGNLLAGIYSWLILHGMSRSDEVRLTANPLFHIGGLASVLYVLALGAKNIILGSGAFDAKEVLRLISQERVTSMGGVPTQWAELCEARMAEPDVDLALRRVSCGASPLPEDTLKAMRIAFNGVSIFHHYGQTEVSGVATSLSPEDLGDKWGSVGLPVINLETRILGEDGREVGPGEVGEICFRGPAVALGYWNDPESTTETFGEGWLRSGDLCTRDAEGFITVVGRKKDMIISGGENIYAAEVERVLRRHPHVSMAAVVGIPHPKWVETPHAFIVVKQGQAAPTFDEISDHCKQHLASYKKPTSMSIIPEFPRTQTGKVDKSALKTHAMQGMA